MTNSESTATLDNLSEATREFLQQLDGELDRAVEARRRYAIIACVPQLLPGEHRGDAVYGAAHNIRSVLRQEDVVGTIEKEAVLFGIPDVGPVAAGVLAHRLKSELRLRTANLGAPVWQSGYACMPDDGATTDELLESALYAARLTRRLGIPSRFR